MRAAIFTMLSLLLAASALHCGGAECVLGDRTCVGTVVRQCGPDGRWQEVQCRPGYTCGGGVCRLLSVVPSDAGPDASDASDAGEPSDGLACQDGSRRCLDQQRYSQCIGGSWFERSCPAQESCKFGFCQAASGCQEGASRCQDTATALHCQDGVWQSSPCTAPQRCDQGRCQAPSCQAGESRCDNATTRAVCTDGAWVPAACPQGTSCAEGQCRPVAQCQDGATRCADAASLETCAQGQWQRSSCPSGQRCEGDQCKPIANPTSCSSPCQAGQICRLGQCVSWSTTYRKIPFAGPKTDRDPPKHADLNPKLRGWQKISGQAKGLVDINGPTDVDAPKIYGMFASGAFPGIVSNYQAGAWDWSKNAKSGWVTSTAWKVHYVGFKTTPGEALSIPSRRPIIYTNANALVLYLDQDSITFVYTREDTVAIGYAVHVIGVHLAEDLKRLYQQTASRSTNELPALENGKPFGVAIGGEVLVAVRDSGTFMDPRARKDWW